MKFRKVFPLLFSVLILLILLITGCSTTGASGGGSTTTLNPVETQSDANSVARAMRSHVFHVASDRSGSQTWSNESKTGYETGTVVVNGSFVKTSQYVDMTTNYYTFTYNNVTMAFDNFSDSEYYPQTTGTLTIDGRHNETDSFSDTYSGGYQLTGSLTLTGYYTGTASINLWFIEDGRDISGSITTNGSTWPISIN